MKNLIVLALLAAAAWYGWKNKDVLFHPKSAHEAVIQNDADVAIVHLRFTVGSKSYAKDRVDAHSAGKISFDGEGNASFKLQWHWEGREVEPSWDGGFFQQGPVPTRHVFAIDDGGGVTWTQSPMPMK